MIANIISDVSHREVFNPRKFEETCPAVHVIGLGAVGSKVVFELVKAGISKLHLWDFDKVEAHNVGNQLYSLDDIGIEKAEALSNILSRDLALELPPEHIHGEYTGEKLSGIVYMCADSMKARHLVFDSNRLNPAVSLIIESRMGVSEGTVFSINPSNLKQVAYWKSKSDYSDEDAFVPRSACGASVSVGSTAGMCACYAVSQLLRWYRIKTGQFEGGMLDNEILFGLEDVFVLTTKVDNDRIITS